MPGTAEYLEIFLAVGSDLIERLYKIRKELQAADLASLYLSDKVAKRLADKFPLLVDALREKDPGYDTFLSNAHVIMTAQRPFFDILVEIHEFQKYALELLMNMSSNVHTFSLELNELVFSGYYNLMLRYTKLHLLVGVLAQPSGRGKLALAAYTKAYAVINQGRVPTEYDHLARLLLEYEQPLPKLQEDMMSANLRVADTLLPLGQQMLRMMQSGYLRSEDVLSPLGIAKGGGAQGAARRASQRAAEGGGGGGEVETLLTKLPEARQWLLYGLLLRPEDLGDVPNAIDMLIALLSTTYVLPVHGTEVLYPHTELDKDPKTLLKWLKRKDEAKRFSAMLKESRLTAYRTAGTVHASARATIATKLANFLHMFRDSPSMLSGKLQTAITILRLAQDEVEWWANHADAVPPELTRKERDERRDPTAFMPHSVLALLRYSEQLHTCATHEAKLKLKESGASRMGEYHGRIDDLISETSGDMPGALMSTLMDLPDHIAHASDPYADLAGMRLNVLRIVCELSTPSMWHKVGETAELQQLLVQLHQACHLSHVVDAVEPLFNSVTEPTALLADPHKIESLFAAALDAKPQDSLVVLRLAARSLAVESPLEPLLGRLGERLSELLTKLTHHFRVQRTDPQTAISIAQASQHLCTLCTALDRAPILTCFTSKVRLNLELWLKGQLKWFVDEYIAGMLFPSAESAEPRAPTVALSLLSDLSHTLALLEPHINVDAHAMLDRALVREFGGLDKDKSRRPSYMRPAAKSEAGLSDENHAAERSNGAELDEDDESSPADGAPLTLLERLKVWIRAAADDLMRLDGPQYEPARCRFGGSPLDHVQMSALCRLVGASGMKQIADVMLEAAITPASHLKGMLSPHKEALASIAMAFERSRDLNIDDAPFDMLHQLLMCCRSLGIAIVARQLVNQGTYNAKAELMPPAVTSFVQGLGVQQLPDGGLAGTGLLSVSKLLSSYGMIPGSHADSLLVDGIAEKCGVRDDSSDWLSLPYALALCLFLPEWDHALWAPRLPADGVGGNAHCVVHALHALLCMVEPHMPDHSHGSLSQLGKDGWTAHRLFLCVAALVLRQRRHAMREGKASEVHNKERSLASVVLVLEQLVQLADPLGYGDLERALPYSSLALPCYSAISKAAAASATPDAGMAALDIGDDTESSKRGARTSNAAQQGMGAPAVGPAGGMVAGAQSVGVAMGTMRRQTGSTGVPGDGPPGMQTTYRPSGQSFSGGI